MIVVVDSSVAVKWFLAEPDHALAVALSKAAEQMYAPELLIAEVANVAWKEAIRKNITVEQARAIALQIARAPVKFIPIASLHQRALKIALEVNHSVYDCLYLACAEQFGAYLITADKTLLNKTRSSTYLNFIRILDDLELETAGLPIPMHLSISKLRLLIEATEAFRLAQENVRKSLDLPLFKSWARAKARAFAYDSPGFYKLRKLFEHLTENELTDILTLEFIGEFGPANWSDARIRCEEMLSSSFREGHIRMMIRRTNFLQAGVAHVGLKISP